MTLKNRLLLFNNLVFVAIFFMVNFYTRPAHDDFYSMYVVREMGVIDGTLFQYNHWCTRFIGVFVSFLVTSVPASSKYFLFNTFLFLLFLFAIFRLYRNLESKLSNFTIFNISLFTLSVIFYSTVNIGETWFWLSANSSFTLSFALLILGASFIIKQSRNFTGYFFIATIFLLIGGLNEILSLFVICLMVFLIIFNKRLNITNRQIMKMGVAIFSIAITLVILMLGPGNIERESFFDKISVFHGLILNVKMSGIILIKKLLPQMPVILFGATILSIVLPINYSNYKQINKKKFNNAIILIFLAAIYIFQLPVTYKTQDIAAIRALLPVTTLFFITAYVILNSVAFLKKHIKIILIISLIFQLSSLVYQCRICNKYANAYDKRMNFIEENRDGCDTIRVCALPNSGWIYSAEISCYPGSFTNQHLKKGLNLKCDVVRLDSQIPF